MKKRKSMSAAQKKNQERFKRAMKKAKEIRKKNPGMKMPEAVKKAWKSM